MRYLKIALSVFALLVGAVATAMTDGLFNVSPTVIALVLAGAGYVSVFGIQPFPLPDGVSRVLSATSVFLGTVQVWHASRVTAGDNAHPWLWVAFGAVTVILGVLGKSPITHVPAKASETNL